MVTFALVRPMDEQILKIISRLKTELEVQREKTAAIKDLIKQEIDEDFSQDLWELSERELDQSMGERLTHLNDEIDTRPCPGANTTHGKIVRKFINGYNCLFMKLFGPYSNNLLEKQLRFNEQATAFHLATFICLRRHQERLKILEERVNTMVEDQDLLKHRLDSLSNLNMRNSSTSNKVELGDRVPEPKNESQV